MADKEDESNMTAEAGEGECSSAAPLHGVAGLARSGDPVVLENTHSASNNCKELTLVVKDTAENTVIPEYFQGSVQEGAVLGQDGQVASGLLSERNVVTTPRIETVTTANFSAVTGELVESLSPVTTTIIYVQPDGSFVEGTGLTAEEQRQLVEQLAHQQLVEVTEHEAARLFQQQRPPFIPGGALAPSELQQVIDQVSRSQQSAAQAEPHSVHPPAQRQEPVQAVCEQPPASISLPPGYVLAAGSPTQDAPARTQPLCIVHNASQQLQNVAKQVALQQGQSHNGTRLIHKKQLETIRIQVPIPPAQHEAKPRPVAPLALLQQRAHPTGQTPKVGVSTPQIIHITPVIGQQQYVLANPGEPPIQLLLQRPASLVGGAMQRPASLIGGAIPVLHKVSLQTPVNGKAGRPAPSSGHAPAPAPPTSHGHAPAPAPPASGAPEQKEKQKPRRPQKVQTRSGRVSRPPKHKVKDYKFIKTEDLVDGRQSDSDDYSEISVEEESGEGPAGGGGNPNVAAAANVYLTTKTFKCRSCEKAYIGLGGLTRHYRLNPGHAPPPLGSETDTPPASAPTAAQTGHCSSASTNQITSNPAEPVPMATPGVALATAPGEKVDLLPLQGALAPGPGKPRGRTGRPRAGAHAGRRGRPGRPPKTLQPPQRRARLKEVLQVCDDEDLMEMVLPRLARVMTLWEFLLMKVDKGHPSMPQFSDVYREFEQLHTQVKKMAQDHFSGPHGTGPHAVLDVRDPQVCQSLGIGHLVTRLKTLPSEIPAVLLEGDLPAKNTGPREDCKTLPPAKRFKMDQSNVEPNGTFLSQNRTVLTAAGVGPSPGSVEIRHQDRCLATKSLLPEKNPTEVVGYQPMELSSHPQTALGLPSPQTETEEQQANITDPAGPSPSHTLGAEPGEGVELNGSDVADQMQQLEQVLSSDVVPLDHTYRAHTPLQTQPCTQPPGQTEHAQTITQPHGQTEHAQTVTQLHGQTEHAQTITQPSGQTEHAQKLASPGPEEQAESLGGTVEQVSGDPVEFQEQIFIQTEEGLILPGGVLTSERIVIVTSPDGTTMHIRTPDTVPLETVPLETVQALLGIDMGTQPEAVLVSENHP